jgi:lipopolysaccharide transport protein LptA
MVLLMIAGTLSAAPARLDIDKSTPIQFESGVGCTRGNFGTGTLETCDITLRQGSGTLIKAEKGSAKRLSQGYEDGEWQLNGGVHIEFDDAILDADSATVLFADNRLKEVHVRGANGKPAHFSHQVKNTPRRNQGRAATIDYDSMAAVLRLAGDTWYSDGRSAIETAAFTYNLNDGSFFSNESVKGTVQPDKRVPPPRTPDRATSQ